MAFNSSKVLANSNLAAKSNVKVLQTFPQKDLDAQGGRQKQADDSKVAKTESKSIVEQIKENIRYIFTSWGKIHDIVEKATDSEKLEIVGDKSIMNKLLSGGRSSIKNQILDLLVDSVSDVDTLIKFVNKRFGIKIGANWNVITRLFLIGQKEVPFGPEGVKGVYKVMLRLPEAHVKKLKALVTTGKDAGNSGLAMPYIGRIGIDYSENDMGRVETGAYTNVGDKMRGMNMFDTTLTHELGHLVDQNGRYSGQESFRKISGWKKHGIFKPQKIADEVINLVQNAIPSSFTKKEKELSREAAKFAVIGRIKNVEKTRSYLKLVYNKRFLKKDGKGEGDARVYSSLNDLAEKLKVSPLFTHLARANADRSPWYYENYSNVGPRQIHEGYPYRGWWSYDSSARSNKLSVYQFRDPGEEFAEIYATYHMTEKKGERLDSKRREWFESQNLHKM
ncbi:MAG: hypothetical protein ACOX8U_09845 [Bradymonadia bacterium]|jgi:hypothetical protein